MEKYSVIARYAYDPDVENAADDLPLAVGDVVEVLEEIDQDWLLGAKNGGSAKGYFPRGFVERLEETEKTVEHAETPIESASPVKEVEIEEKEEAVKDNNNDDNVREPAVTHHETNSDEFKSKINTFATMAQPPMPGSAINNDSYMVKKPFSGIEHKSSYIPPSLGTTKTNTHQYDIEKKPDVISGSYQIEEEEEAPRMTLKERMVLLQKQQEEEQKAIEAALKRKEERKKAKRPVSVTSESQRSATEIDITHNIDSEIEGDESVAHNEDDSEHHKVATGDEQEIEEENKEEYAGDDNEDDIDDDDDDDEDEEDEEELRKRKLTERMAKLSGGMGMMGMMGMPMMGFPKSTAPKKSKKPVNDEEPPEIAQLPRAIPVLPFASQVPPQIAGGFVDEADVQEVNELESVEKSPEVNVELHEEPVDDSVLEEKEDINLSDQDIDSENDEQDNDEGLEDAELEQMTPQSAPPLPPSYPTTTVETYEDVPPVPTNDDMIPPVPAPRVPVPTNDDMIPPVPAPRVPVEIEAPELPPLPPTSVPPIPSHPYKELSANMTAAPPPIPGSMVSSPVQNHEKRFSTHEHAPPPPPPPPMTELPVPNASHIETTSPTEHAFVPPIARATTNTSVDYKKVTTVKSWWLNGSLPDEIDGDNVYFEVEQSVIKRRSMSNIIYVIYYILDVSLTTRTLEVAYDEGAPGELIYFNETKVKHRSDRSALKSQYIKYGSQVYNEAVRLLKTKNMKGLIDTIYENLDIIPPVGGKTFGAVTYKNNDNMDVKTIDEIRKGDILVLVDAIFESHTGPLRKTKNLNVGFDVPHVSIVIGWDKENGKLSVVEEEKDGKIVEASYKLGKLVEGKVRIFRVVGREYIGW